MATTTTTLSSAVAVTDNYINVASATSVTAGYMIVVGDEIMKVSKNYVSGTIVPVERGLNGTVQGAHVSGENVTHGKASDFSDTPAFSTTMLPGARIVRCVQYAAAGAIALPKAGEDVRANIVGASALAMTIAEPGKELDFCRITITASGTTAGTVAAHTLTSTAGFGGAGSGYTVLTFDANGAVGVTLQAANGKWVVIGGLMDGTLTKVATSIA
jgi:hypothetical protein